MMQKKSLSILKMLQGPNSNKEELVKLGHALKIGNLMRWLRSTIRKMERILGKLRLDSRSWRKRLVYIGLL
jgi:hypothetical protein